MFPAALQRASFSPPVADERAGERVLRYLTTEFDRPDLKEPSRLPTNKELARQLNVSCGTVQAVVRRLAMDGRIQTRRGSGTFLLPRQPKSTLQIGIGTSLERFQDPDGWISKMGGGVFHAAMRQQATLIGVSRGCGETEAMVGELLEKLTELDALILFPYTAAFRNRALIDSFENAGKPVVRIYPTEICATANFVNPDFFGAAKQLGRAWLTTGRRKIVNLIPAHVFTGPIIPVSYQFRYLGLLAGIGDALGERVTCRTLQTASSDETAGYATLRADLERGNPVPDAVFASGDWLAIGALKALEEKGLSVPEEVSLVGASGVDLGQTNCPDLTRIHNELERVGEAAVEMVTRRLALNGLRVPGEIVPIRFIGGGTTRPEENSLLRALSCGSRET